MVINGNNSGKRKFHLLTIDDDKTIHEFLRDTISRTKYAKQIEMFSAYDEKMGLNLLNQQDFNAALIDYFLPNSTGLEIVKQVIYKQRSSDFILISANPQKQFVHDALRLGVRDFWSKPMSYTALKLRIEKLYENHWETSSDSSKETKEKKDYDLLIGESPQMEELYRYIQRVSSADISVLITGESGTGKELIAQEIHRFSYRSEKPFVAINCAAIPHELLESELFGHEKGAFTGAIAKKIGCFEQCQEGTLFLDEIGDLSIDLQVKLLRVLQEKEIQPVGSSKRIPINVRIISATHQDLQEYISQGLFREDLFFRLNAFPIYSPALREKKEDIPIIAQHFLSQLHKKYGGAKKHFSKQAIKQFLQYTWKGNVRELQNLLERLYLTIPPGQAEVQAIPENMFQFRNSQDSLDKTENLSPTIPPTEPNTLDFLGHGNNSVYTLAEVEKILIQRTLKIFYYNIFRSAKALGIGRDTLYRKMKLYQIHKQKKQKA